MRTCFRPLVLAGLLGAAACASSQETSPEAMKATFDAGVKAYDAGDFKTAYKNWKSIDDVDLAAMRNVALMLRTGKGVAKNPKAAESEMAEAAEAGLVTAQADLADMLLKGEAGPPNPKAAVRWLELASQAGHPVAAFELGQLYEEGKVVKQDIEAARNLYKLAADAGMDEAARRLAALPPPPDATAPKTPASDGTLPPGASPPVPASPTPAAPAPPGPGH